MAIRAGRSFQNKESLYGFANPRRRRQRCDPRGPQKGQNSVIRAKSNRKTRIWHGGKASPNHTVIERRFIATRSAKLAANFFSAICLVAIVAYWIGFI